MNIQRFARAVMAGAVFAFVLAGCSSVNLDEQKPAPLTDASAGGASDGRGTDRAPWRRWTRSPRVRRPVQRPGEPALPEEGDSSTSTVFNVKPEFQPVVEATASTWRRRRPPHRAEGNTMSAAAASTNLALGQSRAEAVKHA